MADLSKQQDASTATASSNGNVVEDTPMTDRAEVTTIEIKEEPTTFLDYDLIKKKEPEEDTIDKSILHVEEPHHMFDDVDGPEYVDEDYEGLTEVDGVDHFICGGV
jgi:hypothetical protein